MFELNGRWYPRLFSVEEVNFSAIYRYWFTQECERLGISPQVHGYKTRGRMKESRVKVLGPLGIAGQIYCLEGQHEFREEWEKLTSSTEKSLGYHRPLSSNIFAINS